MSKETILKEFDEISPELGKWRMDRHMTKAFLIKSIDQTKKETREETIREILNTFVEEIGYKSIKCQELTLEPEEVYNLINNKLKK